MQFGIKSLRSTIETHNKVVSYRPTIHSNSVRFKKKFMFNLKFIRSLQESILFVVTNLCKFWILGKVSNLASRDVLKKNFTVQLTKVRFTRFLSGLFTSLQPSLDIVNPSDGKVASSTSVQLRGQSWFMNKLWIVWSLFVLLWSKGRLLTQGFC